ncbi:MAG: alpha/beta hydrolase [Gammaproteobacteria bacterium]|jgi:pimeloyl-ACP methyl ester carboxylesterase
MQIEPADIIWGGVLILLTLLALHLYLRQDRWVFKPTGKLLGTPADFDINYEDVCLTSPGQDTLHGWWIKGRKRDKAVMLFHGTTGNISYELPTIRFLQSLGLSVFAVDYPGYGQSEGQPSERGCLEAADRAMQYLQQVKGFEPGHVVYFGKSLGGALAAYLATKEKSAGLVLHGTFTSVPDLAAQLFPFFPVIKLFVRTKLNCLVWLKHCKGPLLLLHAKADDFIPISHAHRLFQSATVPKKFLQIPGGHDSNDWQNSSRVREAWSKLLSGQLDNWLASESSERLREVTT